MAIKGQYLIRNKGVKMKNEIGKPEKSVREVTLIERLKRVLERLSKVESTAYKSQNILGCYLLSGRNEYAESSSDQASEGEVWDLLNRIEDELSLLHEHVDNIDMRIGE